MKGKPNKPDKRTIELARNGILNLNTGAIDKNKALKHGLVPTKHKTMKGENRK